MPQVFLPSLNELACSLDTRPNFVNDCRSTGNTLARRMVLDVLEYLTLVDSTTEPAEDLGALVVLVVGKSSSLSLRSSGSRSFESSKLIPCLFSIMWT
jgi:hypothetical protein